MASLRLQSVNYPSHSVRHQDFILKLTEISSDLDTQDSSWIVRSAAHGHGGLLLESENFPQHHLASHPGGDIRIVRDAESAASVFLARPGLSGDAGSISLESAASPGHFLRHQEFRLRLHPNDGSELFRKDASFVPHGDGAATLLQAAGLASPAALDPTAVTFQSLNYPSHSIRHRNFRVIISELHAPGDHLDAAWKVTAPLNGESGCLSFEASNFAGHFLVHQDGGLWIKRDTGASPAFRSEGSFIVRPGLTGAAGAVALESSAAPGSYLRHADFVLHVHRNDGSRLFREDATFIPAGGASAYLQQYAAAMGPSTADASGAAVLIAPAPGAGPGTSASPLATLAAELGMPTLSWADIGSPLGSGGGDGSRPLFGSYSGYKVVARTAHALRQARTFSLDHPHVDRPIAAVVEGGRELLVYWRMATNMRRLFMRAQRRRHGEPRNTSHGLGRASGFSRASSRSGGGGSRAFPLLSEGQLAERFSLLYKACHALAYAHGSPVGAVPHGSLCPAAVLVHDLATSDATSVRLAPFDFPARCPAPDAPPATLRRPRGTYACMDPVLLLRLPGGAAAAQKVKAVADSANLAAASAASAALAAAGSAAAAGGAGIVGAVQSGAAAAATATIPTSSDIYSLGCIIWSVLTGEEPYSLAASVAAKRRASSAAALLAAAKGAAGAADDAAAKRKGSVSVSESGSDAGGGSGSDSDGSVHSSSTSSSGSSSSTTSCSSDDGSDGEGDHDHHGDDAAAAAGGAGAAAHARRRRIAARRAYTPPLEPHTAGLRRLRRAVQLGSPDPDFTLLRRCVPGKYVDFLAPWLGVMWAWEPSHRPSAVDVAGLLAALVAQAQAAAAAETAAAAEAAAETATATAVAQPAAASEPRPESKEPRPMEPTPLPAPAAAELPSAESASADEVVSKAAAAPAAAEVPAIAAEPATAEAPAIAAAPSTEEVPAIAAAAADAADDVESDNDEDDEADDEDPTGIAGGNDPAAGDAGAATGVDDTAAPAAATPSTPAVTSAASVARRQSVAPTAAARRGSGVDATAAAAAADDDLRARGRGVLDVRVGLLHTADWAAPFVAGYAQLGTSSSLRRAAGGGAGAGSAAGAAAAAAAAEELLLELFRSRDDAKGGLPPFGIVRPCEYALMRGEPEERKKKRAAAATAAAAAAGGAGSGAGDDGGPGDETLCFHLRPLPLPLAIIGFVLPKRIVEVRAHSVGMRNRWWERFKAAGFASAEQYRELAREPTLLAIASGRTLPNGAPCDTPAARAAARTAAGRILEDDHPVFAGPPKRARQKEGAGPTWF